MKTFSLNDKKDICMANMLRLNKKICGESKKKMTLQIIVRLYLQF